MPTRRGQHLCEGRLGANAPALFVNVTTPGPVPVGTQLFLTPIRLREVPLCTADNTAFPQATPVLTRVDATVCAGNTWWWRLDGNTAAMRGTASAAAM